MNEENKMYVEIYCGTYPCAGKDGKDIDVIGFDFPKHLCTDSFALTKVILVI